MTAPLQTACRLQPRLSAMHEIRPQTPGEVVEGCGVCARAGGPAGEGGVALGAERAFTFDYAFEPSAPQETVYETCVRKLVEAALDGYNATVLAYGQVGYKCS
ncbi:Kinesin-like protein KIF21A [Papilio xuthus]|uniref:Kinesin-like protein KIF21A n=1 Tax=Papilio xuthus TaxID=66420 RepID=A0A194PQU3_PAPXU|nr:Kinesin-like protein KIF21A [Papilio xuthus]